MTASTYSATEHLRYLYNNPEKMIAVDTETDGLRVDDQRNKCIGASVSYRDDDNQMQSFYVAIAHVAGENDSEQEWARLKHVLEQGRRLVFANVQFDWFSLKTQGIDVTQKPFYDVITMANMVNENYPFQKSLDNLAEHYLPPGHRKLAAWPWEGKYKLKVEKTTGWPNTTKEMMWDYATTDTELTLKVCEVLINDKRWREIPESVWEHKQKFIRLLFKMRSRGIRVDRDFTRMLEKRGTARMKEINDALGLDLNKPGDKEELFLDRLGLPVVRETKGGKPSFDKFAMDEYAPMLERMKSPIASLFKEYQGWKTAVGAMYRPYLERLSPDGRLRTEYTTHVTATGRLSSKNPNLQQIPKESDKVWNGHTKECFVADPGYVLVNADFSQLELRLAAGYAKEPTLMKTFAEGRDIFTEMAEQLGMSRNDTKTLVYSMQYGAGVRRIMNAFGVDEDVAQERIDNYRRTFPRFQQLNRAATRKAEDDGQLRTWTGRVRHFAYDSDSYKAMNSLIQGGAADVVERVMLRLEEELDDDDKCRILLTVHDSVVFEIREDLVDEYMAKIEEVMSDVDAVTAPDSFGVVFAVDVERWKYTYGKDS